MQRRDILKLVASLTGSAVLAPLSSVLLVGCDSEKQQPVQTAPKGKTPSFFDHASFTLLVEIIDVILPRTDSPSGSDVDVALIMDNMFSKVFKPDYQQRFLTQFAELSEYLSLKGFLTLDNAQQEKVLLIIENTPNEKRSDVYRAYIDIKQQAISYYLLTEEVAENHLNYLPIPGGYTAKISAASIDNKAWAE